MPAANTSHASSKGQVFGYVGVADGCPPGHRHHLCRCCARCQASNGPRRVALAAPAASRVARARWPTWALWDCPVPRHNHHRRCCLRATTAFGPRGRCGEDSEWTRYGHQWWPRSTRGEHAGVEPAGSVNCLHQVYPQNGGEIDMDSATDVASSRACEMHAAWNQE